MKKILSVVIALALAFPIVMAGCSNIKNFGGSTNGIYLYDDLTIQDVAIEEFDGYDYDEFLKALQNDLDSFNSEQNFKVPKESLDRDGNIDEDAKIKAPISIASVENGSKVNLQLIYANAQFYADYNSADMEARGGKEFAAGDFTNPDARLMTATYETPDGEPFDISACSGSSYRYVLCDFDALIYGDGKVAAISKGLTYDSGSKSVKTVPGEIGIVIFK